MRLTGSGAALLLWLTVLGCCLGDEQVTKLSGSNVTFTAAVTAPPLEINWFIVNSKIVDVERGRPTHYYRLQDRVVVDLEQRTFTLIHVTLADSAPYRAASLVNGNLEHSRFILKVLDHVCEVVIHNTTTEDTVALRCACSSNGAPPSKYGWYNGSDHLVSEEQNFTVSRKEEEITFTCVVSNDVSSNTGSIKLPAKPPKHKERLHPGLFALIPIFIAGIVVAVLVRKKCNKPQQKPKDEEQQNLLRAPQGGSPPSPPTCFIADFLLMMKKVSELTIKKGETDLMKIALHLQPPLLEKLRVGRGNLTILHAEEGDYGKYTAEVHPHKGEHTTWTFCACESAQNGDAGAHDDPLGGGNVLVYPKDGALIMPIKADHAKAIIWRKDGGKFLTVTCGEDPLLGSLALSEGALHMALISGEEATYHAEVPLPDESPICYRFDVKVHQEGSRARLEVMRSVTSNPTNGDGGAFDFGNLTLCPVNAKESKKITWKKDDQSIVAWEAAGNARYSSHIDASLDPVSGHLTLKNIQEKDNGQYVVEMNGDPSTVQTFSVTIKLETVF